MYRWRRNTCQKAGMDPVTSAVAPDDILYGCENCNHAPNFNNLRVASSVHITANNCVVQLLFFVCNARGNATRVTRMRSWDYLLLLLLFSALRLRFFFLRLCSQVIVIVKFNTVPKYKVCQNIKEK